MKGNKHPMFQGLNSSLLGGSVLLLVSVSFLLHFFLAHFYSFYYFI